MIFPAFKLNITTRQIGRDFLYSFRDLKFARETVTARDITTLVDLEIQYI